MELLEREWIVDGLPYPKEAWHDLMCLKFLPKAKRRLPTGEEYEYQVTTSGLPKYAPLENPDDPVCWPNFWLAVESYCAENGFYLDGES